MLQFRREKALVFPHLPQPSSGLHKPLFQKGKTETELMAHLCEHKAVPPLPFHSQSLARVAIFNCVPVQQPS